MRQLVYSLLFIPLFFSCSSNNNDKNIKIIEAYVTSVEDLDYKTMESLLADDYIGMGPSFGDSINKKDAVENWKYYSEHLYKKIFYQKSRNANVIIKGSINEGEWVSNWAELEIEYLNGKKVSIWANTVYQLKDGKIIKSYTFYNEWDALRQMGYVYIDPQEL